MKQITETTATISRRTLMRLAGGAAAFSSTRSFALVGGAVQAVQPREAGSVAGRIDWQPVFLERSEALAVARLTEAILPRTDTPGAIDANVPAYVDLVLSLQGEALQTRFRERLAALQNRCRRDHAGLDLAAVSSEEVARLLGTVSDDKVDRDEEDRELRALFRELKQHTVVGYYTSLEGRTRELGLPPRVQRVQWQGCSGTADHRGAG